VPRERALDIRPLLHIDLNESAFLGIVFPRRGLLASLELHHDIADAPRFAGLHLQVLADVVALVEQPERRHTILHRRAQRFTRLSRRSRALRDLLGHGRFDRLRLWRLVVARGQRDGERQQRDKTHDQESGVQAS